ncbi:hypothetical protein COY28_01530 [Candidatus Woesearchaeota archaeon CG_4_10_14_0_2_um_filter_57_5]|nr:MAG: hypothetical protein AUJ68_07125 [Candidatus Woesearchaeota archaeon CG1_02_57_44]PIN68515.1 MAG: hypothetical protein COV94_04215 [Candidatus Woesearchaeota archaeon CG11_big_fil_rev_8_21_14_0_20_57_5]PIZ55772.1 MAG: hypothetical protein COY28_01530 [Candidatus Woesearchaeota archaeon CG_4_10_14_0_2_um_filter_57_5]
MRKISGDTMNDAGKGGAEGSSGDKSALLLGALFVLSTAYLLWQHSLGVSWDFAAFVASARHWFSGGTYFEVVDPPLTSLLLALLSVFGERASEYLLIVLSSALFFWGVLRLSNVSRISALLLYAFSLTPYMLWNATINGSELLSLALLLLFITSALEGRWAAGMWLGLAVLTRYNLVMFAPLLLLLFRPDPWLIGSARYLKSASPTTSARKTGRNDGKGSWRNWRQLLYGTLALIIVMVPWLLYCWIRWGHPLMGVADAYALNIAFRRPYMATQTRWIDSLLPFGLLLPFALWGLIIGLSAGRKQKGRGKDGQQGNEEERGKEEGGRKASRGMARRAHAGDSGEIRMEDPLVSWVMFAVLLLGIIQYKGIIVRDLRYVFPLVLPAAYFSALALRKFRAVGLVVLAMLVYSLVALGQVHDATTHYHPSLYTSAIDTLQELNLTGCRLMSTSWPVLNYFGQLSEPSPREELLDSAIAEGNLVLLFWHEAEPEYVKDRKRMELLSTLAESDTWILLGTGACNAPRVYDMPYTWYLNETITQMRGEGVDIRVCHIFGLCGRPN